jgi:hypothetical protein
MIKVVGVGILSNYSIDGFVLSGTSKELGELFGGGGVQLIQQHQNKVTLRLRI